MADIFTHEKRSQVMSRIRSRNTKPELAVRSMLHRLGYRFTVNGPKSRCLPSRPDIVLPKYRTVIFVNGCFWHGHEHCPNFRMPKSRRAFWKKKIEGNIARDAVNEMKLRKLGWHVVTVWECDLHNSITKKHLMKRLPVLLKN
jgi:DNA mismatch endonuclease (patch repair protein)